MLHGLGRSHQVRELSLPAQLAPQPLRFRQELFVADGPLEQWTQDRSLRRLFQKPEGAEIVDDCERLADAAEARQNHRRGQVSPLEQVP